MSRPPVFTNRVSEVGRISALHFLSLGLGLAKKRSSEIFAALTRWIDGGLVKRKEHGVYEKVG